MLEPVHHSVDLRLRQLHLQALLQLTLRRALGQAAMHRASKLSYDRWRDLEWSAWTPFVPHASGDSLSRHLLGNPTDRIDVHAENTGHFHASGELGVHQLRH